MSNDSAVEKNTSFFDAAKERFGDKIFVGPLKIEAKDAEKLGFTVGEIEAYDDHAWLKEQKCPNCNAELMGLFGTFQWAICHGIGFCSGCKRVEFRFYHYVSEGKAPLQLLALSGF